MTKIVVDALGGDQAPHSVIEAVVEAARDGQASYGMVGPVEDMFSLLKKHGADERLIELIDAPEKIEVSENPVMAIRKKKQSTIVRGLQLVKEGRADAFVSAGSTGALMAGSLLILGRIPGVSRPAIPGVLQGLDGSPLLLLDLGANVDVTEDNLFQFAMMGATYAQNVLGVDEPRIGLLNVGTEDNKGNELTKGAYRLLRRSGLHFCGNVEARDFFHAPVDVVVCDGFSGNIALKSMEGLAEAIFQLLKQEMLANTRGKFGAMLLKPVFKKISRQLDYRETGGAPLLGVNGVCIKCHGSSNSRALRNGLKVGRQVVESRLVEQLLQQFKADSGRNHAGNAHV